MELRQCQDLHDLAEAQHQLEHLILLEAARLDAWLEEHDREHQPEHDTGTATEPTTLYIDTDLLTELYSSPTSQPASPHQQVPREPDLFDAIAALSTDWHQPSSDWLLAPLEHDLQTYLQTHHAHMSARDKKRFISTRAYVELARLLLNFNETETASVSVSTVTSECGRSSSGHRFADLIVPEPLAGSNNDTGDVDIADKIRRRLRESHAHISDHPLLRTRCFSEPCGPQTRSQYRHAKHEARKLRQKARLECFIQCARRELRALSATLSAEMESAGRELEALYMLFAEHRALAIEVLNSDRGEHHGSQMLELATQIEDATAAALSMADALLDQADALAAQLGIVSASARRATTRVSRVLALDTMDVTGDGDHRLRRTIESERRRDRVGPGEALQFAWRVGEEVRFVGEMAKAEGPLSRVVGEMERGIGLAVGELLAGRCAVGDGLALARLSFSWCFE